MFLVLICSCFIATASVAQAGSRAPGSLVGRDLVRTSLPKPLEYFDLRQRADELMALGKFDAESLDLQLQPFPLLPEKIQLRKMFIHGERAAVLRSAMVKPVWAKFFCERIDFGKRGVIRPLIE